jgi:small subunit ribosomal protein S22
MKNYMILLNKACLRFEPDDPEFIRITHRCYQFINEAGDHDTLHSTRFFGPMTFYLAWYKKIDNLLAYMLNKSRLEDCADAIRLYSLIHAKEDKTADYIQNSKSDLELVKVTLVKLIFLIVFNDYFKIFIFCSFL